MPKKNNVVPIAKHTFTSRELLERAERWLSKSRRSPMVIRTPLGLPDARGVVGFGAVGNSTGVIVIEPWAVQKHVERTLVAILKARVGGEWFLMISEFSEWTLAIRLANKYGVGILRSIGPDGHKIHVERATKTMPRDHLAEIGFIARKICGPQQPSKKRKAA